MSNNLTPEQLLRWYLDAGVDEAIGESALDRYDLSARQPQASVASPPARPPVFAAQQNVAAQQSTPSPARATAAQLAAAARSLDDLRRAMEEFDGCPLKLTAQKTVFGDGNPAARVMVIGEAPGADEDREGRPFVGVSGKLLDLMLRSIGLDRATNTYITNVVPWRPPANRKPTPQEVESCLPFLERHIELVDPELLILFGGAAASAVLARPDPIGQLRGRWHDYGSPGLPRPLPCIATYHPAFLLRTPAKKRDVWRDLLTVSKRLNAA